MQCNHAINNLFIVIICKISIRGNSSIIIRQKKKKIKNKKIEKKKIKTREKNEIQQIKPLKNTVNKKRK